MFPIVKLFQGESTYPHTSRAFGPSLPPELEKHPSPWRRSQWTTNLHLWLWGGSNRTPEGWEEEEARQSSKKTKWTMGGGRPWKGGFRCPSLVRSISGRQLGTDNREQPCTTLYPHVLHCPTLRFFLMSSWGIFTLSTLQGIVKRLQLDALKHWPFGANEANPCKWKPGHFSWKFS